MQNLSEALEESSSSEKQEIVLELETALGPEKVVSKPHQLKPFECDGLTARKAMPYVVVLPETLEEIQAVLAIARVHQLPVVTRGSGTSLSGGAMPHSQGILLVLSRMNKVLEFNPEEAWIRVQPGIFNARVSEYVKDSGFYYAPDPSSQIICSIGGNIAENSGGIHCLKYGTTLPNILEITYLNMKGEVFTYSRQNSPGIDLMTILVGSEGLLGIVIEAKLKLLPIPPSSKVMMISFASVRSAAEAVSAIISSGVIPAALEMLDKLTLQAVNEYLKLSFPENTEAVLLCELDGQIEEVQDLIGKVEVVLEEYKPIEYVLSKDEQDKKNMWLLRKSAFPAIGKTTPDYYCIDGSIPRSALADTLEGIERLSKEHGLRVCNVFHAGDGNLHPLILYDAKDGETDRAEVLGEAILQLCLQAGGSVTGEHGVGIEKLNSMCEQFSTAELEVFHALKKALDPSELLNPGKAIPTLARCSELGGMHVHEGRVPYPEVERF